MEPRGWTSFCYSGHIVEQCPPGTFLQKIKDRCPYCGKEVVGNIPAWGLPGGDTTISVLPLRADKVRYKNEAGAMVDASVAVYAIEKLRIFSEK